jgi:Tol biopolymer transport system component
MEFDIWKYPVDGTPSENVSRAERITHQTGQVQTPCISPDNREIVYLSDSGGHGNLWIHNLESGETRQITYEQDPETSVGVPVWAPDGKNIAFVVRKPSGWTVDLWLVSPDGSNLRRVSTPGGWATWSSDGRWLYYSVSKQGIWELKKISMDGGQPITIRPENLQAPAVAPDGKSLYFMKYLANVNGAADQEIQFARPENGPAQVVGRISGSRIPGWQLVNPVISPDGKWLAMPLSDGGVTNIWALSTVSGKPSWQITDFGGRRTFIARRVSWSPDGKFIFAAVGEGDADVLLLDGLLQQ